MTLNECNIIVQYINLFKFREKLKICHSTLIANRVMMYKTHFGYHDGDSWEALCHLSLKMKYGASYTEVPASPGDFGLDGFIEEGIAFQCYCPERECTDKELYISQRDKINKDTKKLKLYETQVKNLLKNTKIKKWVLLTPHVKSNDIISYCNNKTDEIRGYELDFIDNTSFLVKAEDFKFIHEYIPDALSSLNYILNGNVVGDKRIDVSIDYTNTDNTLDLNNPLSKNALRKHSARFANPSNYQDEITTLATYSIQSSVLFDLLKNKWQESYQEYFDRFNESISVLERKVSQMCLLPAKDNQERFEQIEKLVRDFVYVEFDRLTSNSKEQIIEGVIADWIIRCPLDFK